MKNTIYDKDLQYAANVQPVGSTPAGNAMNVNISSQSANGAAYVSTIENGYVSANNTSSSLLNANATFTGDWEDTLNYGVVTVGVHPHESSATDGLKIEWSADGVTADTDDVFTISANAGKIFTFSPAMRYVRVRYINGTSNQTSFQLQTILKKQGFKPSSHRIQDPIVDEDDAELTKAVICGQSNVDDVFYNVRASKLGHLSVALEAFGDSTAVDAFSRLRISNPSSQFENMMQYDLNPLKMDQSVAGSGAITHITNESSAQLSTGGTASGDRATFQTKRYHRYQAGKSQLIFMTGVIGAAKANVRQRIGLFDDNDGLFFEQDENGKYIVVRTSTSGSPVDTRVESANWNIDAMDGTGLSGKTLDLSKAQIFIIDFQWLGVGRVRFGFDIDGIVFYVHEVLNSNNGKEEVYMQTPHLPIRYEIENTGTAASLTTMKAICCAVIAEGGQVEEAGNPFAIDSGASVAVTTRRPIISIRPATTFNSITNRGHVVFESASVMATTNNCVFEIVRGGTLTGANFTNVDANNSITQYDVAANAISGGVSLNSGYALAGAGASSAQQQSLSQAIEVFNDLAGTTPEILSLVATSFTGTSNVRAIMRWTEQR